MSERATAYNMTPQPQAHGTELAVRPKVLRRPAHFGAPSIEAPVPVLIPLHTAQHISERPAPTATRAWQDDGKFAITLLAFIIIVNLGVSAWLAAISPVNPAAEHTALVETAPAVHVLDNNARDISEQ